MNKKNKPSSQKQTETTENTIVWKSEVNKQSEGNIIHFPSKQEATYQEISIGRTPIKLKIISSGFGSGRKATSTPMQLAA